MNPMHPDDLPEPEAPFDFGFTRVLHNESSRATIEQKVFQLHRGDLLDEHARKIVNYIDALQVLESKVEARLMSVRRSNYKAKSKERLDMYSFARDTWNCEVVLLILELRHDLADLLDHKYGDDAKELVELLRRDCAPDLNRKDANP